MIPTPHTVTHIPRRRTGENGHGQAIITEGKPRQRKVFGWQPVLSTERNTASPVNTATPTLGDRSVEDLLLLTPDSDYEHTDLVVIEGRTYEVSGEVRDYTKGPFGYAPGCAVPLRRVSNA